MKKTLFLLLSTLVLFSTHTLAQKRLKLQKVKIQYWNDNLERWSGWPGSWTYLDDGKQPVMSITKLDDRGYRFKVQFWMSGEYFSFNTTYNGYDEDNEWHKYEDSNGDEIAIVGSTMSYLSKNGWPDNKVQVYFWLYSEDFALVME
ncbi:MAG: hypothetical protein D6730_03540 [Bacteroidetes bacterium]|nr:MAG: hypothetical protein D6730_03540 [Bacteroidota bacterium]